MIDGLRTYPTYKESDVPWLGLVPEHWKIGRAKGLFRKMDRPIRDTDEVVTCFRDGIVTLRKKRRVRGFTEALKEAGYQGVRRGDLVIHGMDAFAGAIGVADSDGKSTPVYSVCQPEPAANARYYAYLLRETARSQWILALAKGIRERSTDFRFESFGSQLFPVPPFAEQAAIVRFLAHVDRRISRYIRAKERLIELLEEQKQAIIHQVVTGKIDVRNGQPYSAYKDSGVEWLGRVPRHWNVVALRECGSVSGGMTPSMTNRRYWGGAIPWVTPKDMKRDVIDDSRVRVTRVAVDETSLRLVPAPAVLMVVRGMILARKVPIALTKCAVTVNQDMKALVPTQGMRADFLARLLGSAQEAFVPMIDTAGHGTCRMPTDRWRALPVAVPPDEEQAAIVEFLTSTTKRIARAQEGTRGLVTHLGDFRNRLFADVVTGKLNVREAAVTLSGVEPLTAEDKPEPTLNADDEGHVEEMGTLPGVAKR